MEDRTVAFDGPQLFAGSDKAANVLLTSALVQMAAGRTPEQVTERMRVLGMTEDGDAIRTVVSAVADWAARMAKAAPEPWPRRVIGPLADLIRHTGGPTAGAEGIAVVVSLLAGGMPAQGAKLYLATLGAEPVAASETTEQAVGWVRKMIAGADAAVSRRVEERK